ncbi:hypothetical protein ABZ471_07250, partial [Streptomyces sp. NPDC005728]|uniref:hypothetical protein n=1 Tax=Streptomyces sp. NPDC005728 TaxID=3157054 RepID=UPI0033FEF5EB
LVLDLLRAAGAEGISRLELAERTGLTPQAVSPATAGHPASLSQPCFAVTSPLRYRVFRGGSSGRERSGTSL